MTFAKYGREKYLRKKKKNSAFSLDHCIHETLGAMQEIGTKDIFNEL